MRKGYKIRSCSFLASGEERQADTDQVRLHGCFFSVLRAALVVFGRVGGLPGLPGDSYVVPFWVVLYNP